MRELMGPGRMQPRTTTLEHVGEWKVSIDADTLEDLFGEIARLIARSGGKANRSPGEWEPVLVQARDRTTLLVDWANELLGRSEMTGRAYSEARHVRVRDLPDGTAELAAEIRGRAVDVWRSPLKAATYHGLSMQKTGRGWRAVLLLDV